MENPFNSLNVSIIKNEEKSDLETLLEFSSQYSKFFCLDCERTPEIQFKYLENLTISCGCSKDSQLNLVTLQKYIININGFDLLELEKYFICQKHRKIFKFYCRKHNFHMCNDCELCEDIDQLIDFNIDEFHIKEKILFIAKCLHNVDNNLNFQTSINDNFDKENINDDYLKKLISTLIYEYLETPNIIIRKNINKFYQILLSLKNEKNKNDIEVYFEIKSFPEYKENEDKNNEIKNIRLSEINFDINILRNKTFNNLEKLNLEQNNISNIEALKTICCKNLIELNLRINHISDDMIACINNLEFACLETLDLSNNFFKNYKIFKSIEHFKKLKTFNINSNLLSIFSENDTYNLNSLESINLANGVLSEFDINITMKHFIFQELKKIDFSDNNIKTLSFLKDINLDSIEEIILNNNEIKDEDLEYLNRFPSLKMIDIKNNNIQKIECVNNLISNNPFNLEKVNILGNPINLNSKKNRDYESDYFNKEIDLYLFSLYKNH